jgi:hypothetical protein
MRMKQALRIREQYLFSSTGVQRFDYVPRAALTRCGSIGRGSFWGWLWMTEIATGDWYIRRSAAQRFVRGEMSKVTDPVIMLHAGSIPAKIWGSARARLKGGLLEMVGVDGGVADLH